MADLSISLDVNGVADWQILNGDLLWAADSIQTSVIISLLTNRGTWFGDAYSPYVLGSELYKLQNAVITDQNQLVVQAKQYCADALQWMISDNIVSSFVVTTQMLNSSSLGILVQVYEYANSSTPLNYSYSFKL